MKKSKTEEYFSDAKDVIRINGGVMEVRINFFLLFVFDSRNSREEVKSYGTAQPWLR